MRRVVRLFAACSVALHVSSAQSQDLKTLQDASRFAGADGSRAAAAPVIDSRQLIFSMERQQHRNWCWAANSKSVSAYYTDKTDWSQCKIAGSELDADCCKAFSPEKCDKAWRLDRALQRTDTYDDGRACAGKDKPCGVGSFDDVAAEIDKGRVLGIRIGWDGGGGHFIAIYGYGNDSAGKHYYLVDDPIWGKSVPLAEEDLLHAYRYTGSWTHSYFTRAPEQSARAMPQPLQSEIAPSLLRKMDPMTVGPTPVKFALAPIDERFSEVISRVRPDLGSLQPQARTPANTGSVLAVPHAVYVAGLNQLAASPNYLPEKPAGTRILEMAEGQVLSTFDVKNAEGKLSLVGASTTPSFTAALSDGLKNATRLSERTSETPELRVLLAPALYFEALWLHYNNASEDTFVIIKSFDLPLHAHYSRDELLARLGDLARQSSGTEEQSEKAP